MSWRSSGNCLGKQNPKGTTGEQSWACVKGENACNRSNGTGRTSEHNSWRLPGLGARDAGRQCNFDVFACGFFSLDLTLSRDKKVWPGEIETNKQHEAAKDLREGFARFVFAVEPLLRFQAGNGADLPFGKEP